MYASLCMYTCMYVYMYITIKLFASQDVYLASMSCTFEVLNNFQDIDYSLS
jgi:hypothetical protein